MEDRQLEEELRYQITPVNCVVVLSELYFAFDNWIQFEINLANSLSKPIIGIKPWGSERMPVIVEEAANEVVGWDTGTIVKAIREHSR